MRARRIKAEIKGKTISFPWLAITEDGRRIVRIELSIRNVSPIGRVMKQHLSKGGYLVTNLWHSKDKKIYNLAVHQMVSRTFLGPRPEGTEVNHKDGVKVHNHYKNLEYLTRSENIKHSYDIGLHVGSMKGRFGMDSGSFKLTDDEVKRIRKLYFTEKYTQGQLAKKFGVEHQTIGKIVRGEMWPHIGDGKRYSFEKKRSRGEDHCLTKLCNDDVIEIRRLYSTGKYSHRKLAIQFGLKSKFSIGQIVRGETWTHLL